MAAPSSGTEQAPSFSSPQEEALLNLMRAADWMHRAMQQRLRHSGLTPTQYNVLRILRGARPAGLTCSAIGHRMITPEPDITRLLGRLKAQKFLSQHRDPQDRRVVWTQITAEGMNVLGEMDSVVDQAPRDLLRGLSCEEVRHLIRLLRKMQSCANEVPAQDEEASVTAKPHSPASPRLHPRPE